MHLERKVLGGLIKFPILLTKVGSMLATNDFFSSVHKSIFSILLTFKNSAIDKTILTHKLHELGIKSKDDIDIADYIEALDFTQMTEDGIITVATQIKTLSIKRTINDKITLFSKSIHSTKSPAELVSSLYFLCENELEPLVEIKKPYNLLEAIKNKPLPEIEFLLPAYGVAKGYLTCVYGESRESVLLNLLLSQLNILCLDEINNAQLLFNKITHELTDKNLLEQYKQLTHCIDYYNINNKTIDEIALAIKLANAQTNYELILLNFNKEYKLATLNKLSRELKKVIVVFTEHSCKEADTILEADKSGILQTIRNPFKSLVYPKMHG